MTCCANDPVDMVHPLGLRPLSDRELALKIGLAGALASTARDLVFVRALAALGRVLATGRHTSVLLCARKALGPCSRKLLGVPLLPNRRRPVLFRRDHPLL